MDESLYAQVRELILTARKTISRGINFIQVHVSFEIGRHIVEREQQGDVRADYGKEIIKYLAERLKDEFGGGFSERNLAYMRTFYTLYREREPILQSLIAKSDTSENGVYLSDRKVFTLGWTHYIFLIGIKNPQERSFYEIEATEQSWTVRELRRQFDSGLFERLALSRDKEGIRKLAKEGQIVSRPEDVLKDPLVLEFLGMDEKASYSESDLENAIINRIERFLLELGKGFLFEARQKRFTFDSDHFFVDLVFYNRLLRSYVLIDLKIGKLTHQDLGQMQMYVNYFDRFVKTNQENPTIGIILCKQKNESLVEITLPKETNIHASEYQLYLPSKEELQDKLAEWAKEAEAGYGN